MLRLQSAASQRSSGDDDDNNNNNDGKPRMGVWLACAPRKLYKCSLCHLSFHSLNALGGHQNAHRHQRNQMYRQVNVQPQPPTAPPPPVEPTTQERSMDLELSLGCGGPDQKPRSFYQFLPLKEGYSGLYGYGNNVNDGYGYRQTCDHTPAYDPYGRVVYDQSLFPADQSMQVMMADAEAYGRGGGGGSGGFLGGSPSGAAAGAAAMFYEGMGDSEVAPMADQPDFTLRL